MNETARPLGDVVNWVGDALPVEMKLGDYWNGQRVIAVEFDGTDMIVEFESGDRKTSGDADHPDYRDEWRP